jgi:hypothetical protein
LSAGGLFSHLTSEVTDGMAAKHREGPTHETAISVPAARAYLLTKPEEKKKLSERIAFAEFKDLSPNRNSLFECESIVYGNLFSRIVSARKAILVSDKCDNFRPQKCPKVSNMISRELV